MRTDNLERIEPLINQLELHVAEQYPQVKTLRANHDLAEKELGRAERLYASGDVSKSSVDQRRANRDALAGQLDDARANAAVAE